MRTPKRFVFAANGRSYLKQIETVGFPLREYQQDAIKRRPRSPIPDKQTLIEEIAAREHDRNANHTKADWQFTTKNARIKLKHLYPSI